MEGRRPRQRGREGEPARRGDFYLTRLPSHSRASAEYLAETKATRHIPLIFVGGGADEVAKTKVKIPTGIFVSLDGLAEIVQNWFKR
jgi:hypothetical protein